MRLNLVVYSVSTAIGLYWVMSDAYDRYKKNGKFRDY